SDLGRAVRHAVALPSRPSVVMGRNAVFRSGLRRQGRSEGSGRVAAFGGLGSRLGGGAADRAANRPRPTHLTPCSRAGIGPELLS
ncbi:MAG: hypothetical protein ACK55I_05545, partial [bacterium]